MLHERTLHIQLSDDRLFLNHLRTTIETGDLFILPCPHIKFYIRVHNQNYGLAKPQHPNPRIPATPLAYMLGIIPGFRCRCLCPPD